MADGGRTKRIELKVAKEASVPSPKSPGFRRRSVGCFSRRERSAAISIITVILEDTARVMFEQVFDILFNHAESAQARHEMAQNVAITEIAAKAWGSRQLPSSVPSPPNKFVPPRTTAEITSSSKPTPE
jgi:hypothetical protein